MQPPLQQSESLLKHIEFIAYIDNLKGIIRKNWLFDGSREENTAEHSWHTAMSAIVLAPYANAPMDVNKVTQMLLIHDLIEIEAGDTFVYDTAMMAEQEKAEILAAELVFSHLPEKDANRLRILWEEFEMRETPEAKFAKAIDRFMPLYSNICNGGFSWRSYGISAAQVRNVCSIIRDGSIQLWDLTDKMIKDAVKEGFLLP